MDERILKLRVGIVVLAAAIICGILIWRFGDIQLPGTSKYTIFINFTRAPGVTVGTPVRKSGISIGRVTNVELLEDGGVQVTADIEARRKIALTLHHRQAHQRLGAVHKGTALRQGVFIVKGNSGECGRLGGIG